MQPERVTPDQLMSHVGHQMCCACTVRDAVLTPLVWRSCEGGPLGVPRAAIRMGGCYVDSYVYRARLGSHW